MSYRENLLRQTEPLEPHEINDLREWLKVLEADVEMFGPTPQDEARMAAIRRKITNPEPAHD